MFYTVARKLIILNSFSGESTVYEFHCTYNATLKCCFQRSTVICRWNQGLSSSRTVNVHKSIFIEDIRRYCWRCCIWCGVIFSNNYWIFIIIYWLQTEESIFFFVTMPFVKVNHWTTAVNSSLGYFLLTYLSKLLPSLTWCNALVYSFPYIVKYIVNRKNILKFYTKD